ncbi:MAG: DNA cytosine methyltransferase [Actinomycetota bacterium]|nr:DNA cytosine methyltransferase [Actinomycetota bacterium]
MRGQFEGLIIDNFAGGGGASTGIEQALNRPIDIAINHDPVAIAMHKVNHPATKHLCESVWDVDPVKECAGPVLLAWFSPDCKHFSKAKGGKPVEKNIRGLAWVVMRWASMPKPQRPKVIMLENVEEFMTWGPLIEKNGSMYPDPAKAGQTFKAFLRRFEKHGYKVEYRQLRACDYGAPTIRKRLFLIARCDGFPIVWPEPTHGDPKSEAVKSGRLLPWRTAAECIDWSIPAPSIFERQRPLAEATQRRIAKGIMRYVIDAEDPFIVTYYGPRPGEEFRGQPLNEPLRTQTTENRHALVVPYLVGVGGRAGQSRPRGIKEAFGTGTSKADVAIVIPHLMVNTSGHSGSKANKPIPTLTTGNHEYLVSAFLSSAAHSKTTGRGKYVYHPKEPVRTLTGSAYKVLGSSHLVKLKGTNIGQDVRWPLQTITAGGLHFGEVRVFLLQYHGCSESHDMRKPINTIETKDRFGLVTVHGEEYRIADIGLRMLTPRELFRAQGFPDSYVIEEGCFTEDFFGSKEIARKPISKTEQVAKCGNSVCPAMVKALVSANVVDVRKTAQA